MLDNIFEPDKVVLRKTKRILVYPNFTSANYEKDSYVDALAMMISNLNSTRDDLFFHIISPKDCEIEALKFHNTAQFPVLDVHTHPPTMRVNFQVDSFAPVYKFLENDYDLIFSHLPEHLVNLQNMLSYRTHFEPGIFGYCHWFDFPGIVNWKDAFLNELSGILRMKKCFVNTQSQKDLVLEYAQDIFHPDVVEQLSNIIDVHYLGIEEKNVVDSIDENTEKIIVFNHRTWAYKNYSHFVSLMDKLYAQRQDFKVWVPLLKKVDRPYIINDRFDKQGYYNFLRKCRVGFGPKQTYRGWSIAITDGLMNGCPYVMYSDLYYDELSPVSDKFKNDQDALTLLNKYLDDNDYRNWQAKNSLDRARSGLIYNANQISHAIDKIYAQIPRVQSPDKVEDIKKIIKKHGSISKKDLIKELGWGVSIKWNKYRTALLDDPNIFDNNTKNPVYYYKA